MTTKTHASNKHTPGPWRLTKHLTPNKKRLSYCVDACDEWNTNIAFGPTAKSEEAEANARLISLAWMLPELVQALEAVKYDDDRGTSNGRDYLVSRSAMEKVQAALSRYHEQEARK